MYFSHPTEFAPNHIPPPSPGSKMDSLPYSVTDLSYQMSQYTLQHQQQQQQIPDEISDACNSSYRQPRSQTPPTDPPSPASPSSPSWASSPTASTPPSSLSSLSLSRISSSYQTTNVRQQRQRALRRQCSDNHLREISELVARMVNSGDQCSVCTPSTATKAPELVRKDSDPTSDASFASSTAVSEDGDREMDDSTESEDPEIVDECEGYRIQEANGGFVEWNCPWTPVSRTKSADGKACVKKDTTARKRARRRGQTLA